MPISNASGKHLLCAVSFLAVSGFATTANSEMYPHDQQITLIAMLMEKYNSMPADILAQKPSLTVRQFTLPDAGVDVMRAKVEETYEIDGVGRDTVMLEGWIAVKHGSPQKDPAAKELRWGTAKIDTEFVGLYLTGHSEVFGNIKVTLDDDKPSVGVVGYWPKDNVPEPAKRLEEMIQLAADVRAFDGTVLQEVPKEKWKVPNVQEFEPVVPEKFSPDRLRGDGIRGPDLNSATCSMAFAAAACNCSANLNIRIQLDELGFDMTTKTPVYMFSQVKTIPPVNYAATISLTPTKLMMDGRVVGTLEHAAVRFRELIEHMTLDDTISPYDRIVLEMAEN